MHGVQLQGKMPILPSRAMPMLITIGFGVKLYQLSTPPHPFQLKKVPSSTTVLTLSHSSEHSDHHSHRHGDIGSIAHAYHP